MTTSTETRTHVQPRVFYKSGWDWDFETWTEIDDAYNIRCNKGLGNSVSQASFVIPSGKIYRGANGDTMFTNQGSSPPLDVWIRIEVYFDPALDPEMDDPDFYWFGIITDFSRTYLGPDGMTEPINTTVDCAGLEYLLTRVQIRTSKTGENPGAGAYDPNDFQIIKRGVTFNDGDSQGRGRDKSVGNFNGALETEKLAFYLADPSKFWTKKDAIDYLIENHQPTTLPVWDLDTSDADMISSLSTVQPRLETDGQTLFDLLNQVFDRRRGLSWFVEVNVTGQKIEIRPRTRQVGSQLTLPSGHIIEPNPFVVPLDYSNEQHILDFKKVETAKKTYQSVRVRGARAGVVATFQNNVNLLQKWTAGEETAYADAANGRAGYGGLLPSQQSSLNDAERSGERLDHVFTTYGIDSGWNGMIGGEVAVDPAVTWIQALRFETYLPLKKGLDYTVDPAAPTGTAVTDEYVRPIVITEYLPGLFLHMDRLSALSQLEDFGDGLRFSCSVDMLQDTALGLKITPSSVPHSIALNDFDLITAEPTEYIPWLSWKDVKSTLYFQLDEYCEGVWPASPSASLHNQKAELVIDIGSRARKDKLLSGTLLGIEDGEEVTATATGFISDDSQVCEDIAKAAYTESNREYAALDFTIGLLIEVPKIGDIITTFKSGTTTVTSNTIVSRIDWDFDTNSTRVATHYFELDIVGLFQA